MTEIPTFPPARKTPPPLVIVFFISVVGGVVGTLLLFTLFPEYRLAEIPPGIDSVVVDRPGKVVIEEETRIDDLRTQLSSQVGEVFSARSVGEEPDNSLWLQSDVKAYATILTSDGYFVSTEGAVAKGDYIRVRNRYFVVTDVASDPASSLVIGKGDITGLPSPALASHKTLKLGMTALGVLADRSLIKTSISDLDAALEPANHYYSSDTLSLGYKVANLSDLPGLPYFDISGNLIGVHGSTKEIALIPAYIIQTGLESYLQNGKINRPSAELQYASIPTKEGAYVYRRLADNRANELQLADVITAVNGQQVTSDPHSFMQIFENLKAGDTAKFTVQRDADTIEIEQKIGDL